MEGFLERTLRIHLPEFLPVRRRGADTIFSGRGDSPMLLVNFVLDVSAESVPKDLGLDIRRSLKRNPSRLRVSMKASAKSRDTGNACEAGAGSRAVRRFVPDRSSQTLDAANGSLEW